MDAMTLILAITVVTKLIYPGTVQVFEQERNIFDFAAGISRSQSNDGSCTMDGVTYDDGAVWPSMEGCQSCRCSSGLTFCVRTSSCQDLGQCGVIVTLPGSCCPVCFGYLLYCIPNTL